MATERTIYHTQIKSMVREGLLEQSILTQIPRTNIHRWKNEPKERYKDFELTSKCQHDYEVIKSFAQHRSAKRIFSAYVRLISFALQLCHSMPRFHTTVKEYCSQLVALSLNVKKYVGLKLIARIFNISIPTFRNWANQTHTQCFESLTQQCNKVYPNQLSKPEVIRLKELVQDARFQYWPVSSIAHYAMRNELLSISLNTWYKYVNKFGLQRIPPVSRRKKNTVGIRADRPHQIWHADITIFETKDRIKQYIYLVVDNFSRKILSWKVSEYVKASIRKETILDAIHATEPPLVVLLTDGGSENKFDAIQNYQTEIDHKIALIDIHYSNSLVESHNKIIKYNYLYKMEIPDRNQLHKMMEFIVDDFNNRPHISLNGLTPNEVEVNVQLDKIKRSNQLQCATEVRKIYNNLNHCTHCI